MTHVILRFLTAATWTRLRYLTSLRNQYKALSWLDGRRGLPLAIRQKRSQSPNGGVAPNRTKGRRRTSKDDIGATPQISQLIGSPPVGATDLVCIASLPEVSRPSPSRTANVNNSAPFIKFPPQVRDMINTYTHHQNQATRFSSTPRTGATSESPTTVNPEKSCGASSSVVQASRSF